MREKKEHKFNHGANHLITTTDRINNQPRGDHDNQIDDYWVCVQIWINRKSQGWNDGVVNGLDKRKRTQNVPLVRRKPKTVWHRILFATRSG